MKITKTNHRTRQNKSIVALIGKPELEGWDLCKVQAPPRSVLSRHNIREKMTRFYKINLLYKLGYRKKEE